MIEDIVDSIVYENISPEQAHAILVSLDSSVLSSTVPRIMQSFSKKQKLTEFDLGNIQLVIQSAINRMVLTTDREIAVLFDSDCRVIVWIAIVKAAMNMPNCPIQFEKIRTAFTRRIKKFGRFWGYDALEKYYAYIVSRDKQFEQSFRKEQHERELHHIEVVQDFIMKNFRFLPPGFDFRDVLLRYICMNRWQTVREKELLNSSIDKIAQISLTGLTGMRFCFEFFKYSCDEKTAPFTPQVSLIQVIRRYSVEQLNKQIDTTFIGMTWSEEQYRASIKNLIRAGITNSTVAIIVKIKDSALRNNKIEPLIQMTEADVLTAFVYLKYENLFKTSMELIKEFVLGAPPRSKTFQKVFSKVKNIWQLVQQQNKPQFLESLQALKIKYENSCPMQQLSQIIKQLSETLTGYNNRDRKYLEEILEKYDWLSFENKQAQKLVDNKSTQFRGLCNIGNSCYMNSFLQALYMTREFRLQILDASIIDRQKGLLDKLQCKDIDEKRKELRMIKQRMVPMVELQKLFALLYKSKRPYINPSFVKNILPLQFRNMFQHDAGEFGRIFLSSVEESMQLGFEGESQIIIQCQQCHNSRARTEKFWDLMLPPCGNDIESIKSMIDKNNQPEQLEKLECENCKKIVEKSVKRTRIKKLPPYLILTLNRFTYSVELKKKLKLTYKVEIADTIELQEYANGTARQVVYDIYAIIVHRGNSAESGHYYTFTRSEVSLNSSWVCFDDSATTELDSLQKLCELIAGATSDTPYILFYQSREHVEQIIKQKLFTTPFIMSERLTSMIEKQDIEYLKESQRPKFVIPKIPFSSFFRKEDDDDDDLGRPGGNNNHLIM